METTRRGFFGRLATAVGIVVGGTCLPAPRERLQFTTDTDHYPNQGWPRSVPADELYFRDKEVIIMCDDGLKLTRWPSEKGSNFTIEKKR